MIIKRICFLILLTTISQFKVLGQKTSVGTVNRTVYFNWANTIDLFVEGLSCKQVSATTDNGTIISLGKNCQFTFKPTKTGKAKIILSDKKTKKVFDTVFLRVEEIPEATAIVADAHGGEIKASILKAQLGIAIKGDIFRSYLHRVDNYQMSIFRNDSVIFTGKCDGPGFDHKIRASLKTIMPGDHVLFHNIWTKYLGTELHMLQPMEFIITS